jgi:hypothetical protein
MAPPQIGTRTIEVEETCVRWSKRLFACDFLSVRLALGLSVPGRVRTLRHLRTETTPACVRVSPSVAYLLHTPIPPTRCHLRRCKPHIAPSPQPLQRHARFPMHTGPASPERQEEKARAVPPIQKDSTRMDALLALGETMQQKVGRRNATSDLLLRHPKTIVVYV